MPDTRCPKAAGTRSHDVIVPAPFIQIHLVSQKYICYPCKAIKVLHKRYIRGNKKQLESLQRERENLIIAEQIYNLRTQAGFSINREIRSL